MVLVMMALAVAACGSRASANSTASTSDVSVASGCLATSNCSGESTPSSAACKALVQKVQKLLGRAVGPMADITTGPTPPSVTSADIARDKLIIRGVMTKVKAVLPAYATCPNADPNMGPYVEGLKAYLRPHVT